MASILNSFTVISSETGNTCKYKNFCLTTCPCQHDICLNDEWTRMFGDEIYGLCVKNGWTIPPHFQEYKEMYEKSARNAPKKLEETKFTVVNDRFKISTICARTIPCKHVVVLDGKKSEMDAIDIAELCKKNNWTIPEHFRFYSTVKRYTLPSAGPAAGPAVGAGAASRPSIEPTYQVDTGPNSVESCEIL